ncbi:hypothetical protein [Microcoleus sp. FACHB-68]|uniref:hypothetical protein n=1 Tax=Microcoleus sp. FACHB-68 TaxID=2692826 RepID=UPI001683269A|nr:hypothetical protein [Microcoleus sp. FACHB-68]MBD1937245.1 hypothetical protein [Microcoleus sp. FACHB-68]
MLNSSSGINLEPATIQSAAGSRKIKVSVVVTKKPGSLSVRTPSRFPTLTHRF